VGSKTGVVASAASHPRRAPGQDRIFRQFVVDDAEKIEKVMQNDAL